MYIEKAAFVADNYGVTVNTYVDIVQCIMPRRSESSMKIINGFWSIDHSIDTVCVGGINTSPNHSVVTEKAAYYIWIIWYDAELYGTVSYYVI